QRRLHRSLIARRDVSETCHERIQRAAHMNAPTFTQESWTGKGGLSGLSRTWMFAQSPHGWVYGGPERPPFPGRGSAPQVPLHVCCVPRRLHNPRTTNAKRLPVLKTEHHHPN